MAASARMKGLIMTKLPCCTAEVWGGGITRSSWTPEQKKCAVKSRRHWNIQVPNTSRPCVVSSAAMKRRPQHPQFQAEDMSTTLFREDSPRPPVPGEEDKAVSCGKALPSNGRNSIREGQDSVRTPSASASCLGNSSSSSSCQLPGITPRRCHSQIKSENYGKTGGLSSSVISDFDDGSAPLGFEPEGSSIKFPPFAESYIDAATHAKLSEGLGLLLEDVEGIKLFRQFVNDQLGSSAMEFWLACRGLKKMFVELQSLNNSDKVKNLSKVIFKKFVKSSKLDLKPDLKLSIAEKLKRDEISGTIFDEALTDVEIALTDVVYPQFLRCETYLQYIQSKGGGGGAGESPRTQSSNSSECSSIRPTSTLLPTLHEEEELKQEDIRPAKQTQFLSEARKQQTFSDEGLQCVAGGVCRLSVRSSSQPPSVPVGSVQDSELQSLSSEALTDDTVSLTDSSLDGRGDYLPYSSNKFLWKKQQAGIKRNAEANQESDLDQRIIPRLQYSPKDQNIAEKDPERFAMLLTHRLLNIHVSCEAEKTFEHSPLASIQKAEVCRDNHEKKPSDGVRDCSYAGPPLPLCSVLLAAMTTEDQEESAQNILESHMLRVFDGSSGQTPNHLMSPPGRHSPDQMALRSSSGRQLEHRYTEQTAVAYPERSPCIRHWDRKAAAAAAFVGAEWPSEPPTHKCLIHQQMPIRAQKARAPLGCHAAAAAGMNRASFGVHLDSKGLSMAQGGHSAVPQTESRKLATSCHKTTEQPKSLEMMAVGSQQPAVGGSQHPCALDSASEKVMMWMLENEKLSSGARAQGSTECSDRASSCVHKRSAAHFAPSIGVMGRQKQMSQILPSQPIIQDPSMPLLTPPDPTTQLEEARRRLEQEARIRILQSRALVGGEGVGAESRMAFPSAFHRSSVKSHAPLVDPVSSSSDHSSNSQIASESRAMSKRPTSASVPTTPIQQSASDSIVIVYFFCDEQIPYSTKMHGRQITLAQFKQHLAKKGHFRYFFKRFGCETAYEEISDDEAVLPLVDGKISAKISRTA